MPGPLSHLTVIELASVLAGPSVGMFLAELGATVLKIENPRTGGDVTRRWLLPEEDPADDRPAYFCAANWGKRSLAIDLSKPEGQHLVRELARTADVVISSFRPGQASALGVDAARLREANPGLVVAEVDGYGASDPRPGYDAIIQAEAGFMALNGDADGPPTKMPVALMDLMAAHQLREAIILALFARERSGMGAHVRTSLLASGVSSLANQASAWLTAGVEPRRMGSGHPTIAPYGTAYPTATGEIILAVGTDSQFRSLCLELDLDAHEDGRFATNAARVRHRDELDALLRPAILGSELKTLIGRLRELGVPAGAVRDIPSVLDEPEASRLVLRSPGGPAAVRTVAFTGHTEEDSTMAAPPRYGEHTASELASRLGLTETEIGALSRSGAVRI